MSNMVIMSENIKAGLVLRINVEFKRECYLNFITKDILYQKKKKKYETWKLYYVYHVIG